MAIHINPALSEGMDKTITEEVTETRKVKKGYYCNFYKKEIWSPLTLNILYYDGDEHCPENKQSIDIPEDLLEYIYNFLGKELERKRKIDELKNNAKSPSELMKAIYQNPPYLFK
jgi:hypothetical protein